MIGLVKRAWRAMRSLHRARLRALDREILWPHCCAATENIACARGVFLEHVAIDPAWHEEMSAEDIVNTVFSWPLVLDQPREPWEPWP